MYFNLMRIQSIIVIVKMRNKNLILERLVINQKLVFEYDYVKRAEILKKLKSCSHVKLGLSRHGLHFKICHQ